MLSEKFTPSDDETPALLADLAKVINDESLNDRWQAAEELLSAHKDNNEFQELGRLSIALKRGILESQAHVEELLNSVDEEGNEERGDGDYPNW